MINSEKLMSQWAEKYLSLGWSLIPLRTRTKEPLIPWTEFQKRKATMMEISQWLNKYPQMNIGVVTGQISGIVVVDLDGKEGNSFGLQNHVISPCISLTGNGKQVFYKWTEHVGNSVKKLAPGVDIRGDGGYVVLPPSIHPNGKRYRWERFVPSALKPMPLGTIAATPLPDVKIKPEGWIAKAKPQGWISQALEEMKIGNIDDTLFKICSRLRYDGYTEEDARILLQPHAERVGAEPGHLDDKIRNVWSRYTSKDEMRLHTSDEQSLLLPSKYQINAEKISIHSPNNDGSYNKFQRSLESRFQSNTINTGFLTLDKYFEGGLKSERLFTVAARTGTGKTNFAIALASHLCQQGKKVLFFSTEFKYEKIWQRYIATLNRSDEFRQHALYVCDSFSPRIEQVEEAIKRIMPDVFIFDHINHIGEEREGLGAFMQGCNFLQRKYDAQGVMVAQLNRQADWVEAGKRIEPRMSMIKGSGTIEQASSRVLLLSETRVTPEVNEILGVLDKNDSGDRGLINFGLYKSPYIFKELTNA
jgi:hypothetical protein